MADWAEAGCGADAMSEVIANAMVGIRVVKDFLIGTGSSAEVWRIARVGWASNEGREWRRERNGGVVAACSLLLRFLLMPRGRTGVEDRELVRALLLWRELGDGSRSVLL
jgi:hypothetical protein